MKFLVVDDEADVVEVVSVTLKMQWGAEGQVIAAYTGEEAVSLALSERPDLIILDIALPDVDGFEVCRRIREFSDAPILMLTAKDDEMDKVRGLELGADDYITKPFGHLELMARIRAVLRRVQIPLTPAGGARIIIGGIVLDLNRREVEVDGRPVRLTPTEFNLLQQLMRNAGKVLPHETLLARVWGPEYRREIDYLKVYIRRLREKLEPDPQNPGYILTEYGIGYWFRSP